MAELLAELDFAKRKLTPEEQALRDLLAKLIEDFNNRRHPLPELRPHQMRRSLIEQRTLRQRGSIPVFGASRASDVITGKRSISRAHATKLAQFFDVSAALFL